MRQYQELRTLSFRFGDGAGSLPYTTNALRMPDALLDQFFRLQKAAHPYERADEPMGIPIRSLHASLKAFLPDIISIERAINRQGRGRGPWLYADQRVPSEVLGTLMGCWVRSQFSGAPHEQIQETLALLQSAPFQWDSVQVDLGDWVSDNGGAPKPVFDDAYSLLPHTVAARLSATGIRIPFGEDYLTFRRVAFEGKGARLVAWPPLPCTSRKQRFYYSPMITLSVQTVPFQSYPVLHCELGTARWAGPPVTWWGNHQSTVYLLSSQPWIQGSGSTSTFAAAPLRWRMRSSRGGRILEWADTIAPVLAQAAMAQSFPDPERLADNPEAALNLDGTGSFSAAITFKDGLKPCHPMGKGMPVRDRCEMVDYLADLLPDAFCWENPPRRVSIPKPAGQVLDTSEKRRAALARAAGNHVYIEVWQSFPKTVETVLTALQEELGLDPVPQRHDGSWTWTTPGLKLDLEVYPLASLGEPLQERRRWTADDRQAVIQERIDQIRKRRRSVADGRSRGAIVEFPQRVWPENRDPKPAIRPGFAATGYAAQCLYPPDGAETGKTRYHRVRTAVQDLLRQFGVAPELPEETPTVHYLAVWAIHRNKRGSNIGKGYYLPVMVHAQSGSDRVEAIWPGQEEWLPYQDALLQLAASRTELPFQTRRDVVRQFIREQVEGPRFQNQRTLLLCDAQNLRDTWVWLQNPNLTPSQIHFDRGPSPHPDLHLVRIRGKSETPEFYARSEGRFGFTEGVFSMGSQVFASVYGKPKQQSSQSHSMSRAPRAGERLSFRPAWNPGLIELTVVTPVPEMASWWAGKVHRLRHAAIHYSEPLNLPLPLHLACLMEEYYLPLMSGQQSTS